MMGTWMTVFVYILLGGWILLAARFVAGAVRIQYLSQTPPAPDAECPRVSILFAARDEEEKLTDGLRTLVELDYPSYEIIAVDDRSSDATGRILDEFATKFPDKLRVMHLTELPPGWLGKTHGLQRAYEASSSEWICFTDADVRWSPDVLRRAMAFVRRDKLDHLTLFCGIDMEGFWERAVMTFFALAFHLGNDPGGASNPRSKSYAGIGAFQLVRRAMYEKAGTHRRLALEVIDDMKLGKTMKEAGARSDAAGAQGLVTVSWQTGLRNIVSGTTKNFFAATGYRLWLAVAQILLMLMFNVTPFVLLPFVSGTLLALVAAVCAIPVMFHGAVAKAIGATPLYGLTHPLGAMIMSWMVLRSTMVTLWRGGVTWRDTFYPLEELKKGVV
jgi:glycosyltransferase involved in cell wall biosynthesis